MIDGPLPAIGSLLSPVPAASFSALLTANSLTPGLTVPPGQHLGGLPAPEATTILALRYADGVVMVGDRQATEGYSVAHRRMQKVFPADAYSAVAISGTAGLAMEMVRLFQTELEHYEKLEGARLSLEGKANHLSAMMRSRLPMVFQGLVVVPLFAGFDERTGRGHLYTFDVVGGRYEEEDFTATGSGGREAKSALRGSYRPQLDESEALGMAIKALVVAADEDTATAGPDLRREIYPTAVVVDRAGYREIPVERVAELTRSVIGGMA